jgi:hypothetical protein
LAVSDPRLTRLRVELYAAAQLLKGEDLAEFRTLIAEVYGVLELDAKHEHEQREAVSGG